LTKEAVSCLLSLIELRAHGLDPKRGNPIGPPVFRLDQSPPQKALKNSKSAIAQDIAITRITDNSAYFSIGKPFMMD